MKHKGLANKAVMSEYMSDLLYDSDAKPKVRTALPAVSAEDKPVLKERVSKPVLEKLLEQVKVEQEERSPSESVQNANELAPLGTKIVDDKLKPIRSRRGKGFVDYTEPKIVETASIEQPQQEQLVSLSASEKECFQDNFQALFFKVAGLTVALPLTTLGGIFKMAPINSIVGKPDWYMGLMPHRESQFNVVNTAKWVMPEKYDVDLEQSIEYKYLITLGESKWGLACESLVETTQISREDIKWRGGKGKRPWLAGTVKQKMCALIDADELILLLDKGLNNDSTYSNR